MTLGFTCQVHANVPSALSLMVTQSKMPAFVVLQFPDVDPTKTTEPSSFIANASMISYPTVPFCDR